jgi:hypothetical protein
MQFSMSLHIHRHSIVGNISLSFYRRPEAVVYVVQSSRQQLAGAHISFGYVPYSIITWGENSLRSAGLYHVRVVFQISDKALLTDVWRSDHTLKATQRTLITIYVV